jgi:hypothetical protein
MDKVYLAVVDFAYEGEPPIGIYTTLENAQQGIIEYCKKYPESETVTWSDLKPSANGKPMQYMDGYCEGSEFYIYEIPLDKYIY